MRRLIAARHQCAVGLLPPPIDLRADASKLANRTTSMAQDMLRSAKSMFHAVMPNSDRQSSSSASQFTD